MSIEKFLRDINNDIATESESTGSATADLIVTLLIIAIGLGAKAYHDHKEAKKKEKELKEYTEKREASRKVYKEESLEKYGSVENLVNLVKNDAKKMVTKIKQSPEVKKKIAESIEKYKERWDSDDIDYEIVFDTKELGKDGGYIEIIKSNQELKLALNWIIYDMIEALETKYMDAASGGLLSLSPGDGDEGCLYINY